MIELFGLLQAGHYLPGIRKTAGMVTPFSARKIRHEVGLVLWQLDVNTLNLVPQVWRSLDLNPVAVSLLRKRLAQIECACAESRCDGGISGAVSNKGM